MSDSHRTISVPAMIEIVVPASIRTKSALREFLENYDTPAGVFIDEEQFEDEQIADFLDEIR